MKNTAFYFLLSIICLFNSGCKKNADIESISDFEQYVEDEMKDQNIPAMAVLFFKEDEILYEKYLGLSNVEQNTALAGDHLFLLASVSKVVTATALMQLYEADSFELDDPINNYLPFEVKVPNYESTPITFRMLFTHTSAIADGSALDGQYFYGEDPTVNLDFFLENYLVAGGSFYNATENYHNFEPGTDHEYSNEGSALIAVLVEQISGIDFNTYCKQNIFTPLGMTNTSWRLDEINQTIVQPYNYKNGDYEAIQHYTFTDYPNGGLRATASDLFKFLSAWVNNGQSNNYQLLENTTLTEMITAQISDLDNTVGLHMFLMNKDQNLWGHDGGEQGVATIMAFNPSTKVGCIILSNQGEANLDTILEEAYKIALTL